MSAIAVSLIVFACVFGGGLLGLLFRGALPQHHLSGDSKDAVKLGIGLVGTMAALVLGLLVASAKASYDAQGNQLIQLAANAILLDRVLDHYGPEAKETRDALRERVTRFLEATWSKTSTDSAGGAPGSAEALFDKIQAPKATRFPSGNQAADPPPP